MTKKITYKDIQDFYFIKNNRTIKTCWIADIKRKSGLEVKISTRRLNKKYIKNTCPSKIENKLVAVLYELGIIISK